MAKRFVKPSTPRAPYIPPGPAAERGVVRTYLKLIKSNEKFASVLDEIDVEVRLFGMKDFHVKAGQTMLGDGIYKDLGPANEAVKAYVAKMKRQGWKVMNERHPDSESGD